MAKPCAVPASLNLKPIDASALDGRYQLVFSGNAFAVARAMDGVWQHSSGIPVDFTPTHYHTGAAHA